MKAFIAIALLAVVAADQSSHQSIKHGNAPAVRTSIHKPHGVPHAHVESQPAALPNEVKQPYNEEKYTATVGAPAQQPRYVSAPIYRAAPVLAYKPTPTYAPRPALAYKPTPTYAPRPAPAYKPTPTYAPRPAPAYKPARPSYQEPQYDAPAVYQYGYAVADDYSGSNFAANENRDNYATSGEYRVNLPDGRTQIVTYNVADAYSGYVADVRYEGEPVYPKYEPKPVAYAPKPAYSA